ncbi:tyrosine-type recombinase/integrase [Pseudomonadota bacterium]|nr:tyrosine-type recombinase/integrase [Pseudomonadota bacterium]
MIFKRAISDGYITENLLERIIKRDHEKVKRSRLTLVQYKKIYASAPRYIQLAMELSLNAMQRRSDIQSWRFDCEKEGHLHIKQSKTHKHGMAAYLRIDNSIPVAHSESGCNTLSDIIKLCRDNLVCPFVIHKKPSRVRESKEKEHSMQLSGKELSDGFTKARIKAGILIDNPPTFHELLSLGESLRVKQGWSIKEVQALRGHTSEKMTRAYLDGQEWTTVSAPF